MKIFCLLISKEMFYVMYGMHCFFIFSILSLLYNFKNSVKYTTKSFGQKINIFDLPKNLPSIFKSVGRIKQNNLKCWCGCMSYGGP